MASIATDNAVVVDSVIGADEVHPAASSLPPLALSGDGTGSGGTGSDSSPSPTTPSAPTEKEKKEKKDKKDKKDKKEKEENKEKEAREKEEKRERKEREKEEKEKKEREKKEEKERKEREKKEEKEKKEKEKNERDSTKDKEEKDKEKKKEKEKEEQQAADDLRRFAAEEEAAAKRGGWWGKFKESFKPKPTTLKEIVQAATAGEATYRFDFTDFELDVLSNTTEEAGRDSRNMYSVHVERTSLTHHLVQQGETKWAGPASAYRNTNQHLAQMRRECIDWQVNGLLLQKAAEENGGEIDENAKMSTEDINVQADGSFFGIASSEEQGLEYVRCPTDFGTVKEAERYIVRHRWAPSFNVLPIFANIKRLEQLQETDPFGDTADTSTPQRTPQQAPVDLAELDNVDHDDDEEGSGGGISLGAVMNRGSAVRDRYSNHARTRSMGVDLGLGNDDSDDENPFANFQADPNFSLPPPPQTQNGEGFQGYTQAHRRHTATYGGIVGIQQAVANHHQRTMSYGANRASSRATSPPAPPASALTPRRQNDTVDDLEIKPFITYNKTNQNCIGEGSTPYISTIGVNPCETAAAKLKAAKPTSSVVITVKERIDADLSALAKVGGQILPGNPGRKFTQVRLDLTKGSIAAFGGQRYELYFFDDSEEAKRERKKIKEKSDISGGLVPTLVLRFKVQGTLIDKETLTDVTAQSPARRRLLQAKVLDAPAFPYAFVLDRFVVNRNVKASYNIGACTVKVLSGTGVADVNVGYDGAVIIDKREKKEKEKDRKAAKKEAKEKGEGGGHGSSSDDSDEENKEKECRNATTSSCTTSDGVLIQTTALNYVTRLQPLYLRDKFKLCNVEETFASALAAGSSSAGGLTHESGGSASTIANGTVTPQDPHGKSENNRGGSSGDDKEKKSTASPLASKSVPPSSSPLTIRGPPLGFSDLFDCYVLTPQFATTRSMTVGDLFNSNSEAFVHYLAEQTIPSVITEKDVKTLMERPLIKFQCKTENITTTKVYTQVLPCRGSNIDLVLGSPTNTRHLPALGKGSASSPQTPCGIDQSAAAIVSASPLASSTAAVYAEPSVDAISRAYFDMLTYPNVASTQEKTAFSLAPYVSLNTFPIEGIQLSMTFPRKQSSGSPHHYEDEFVTFRVRRFLLPSVTRAGLAPASQWDIPLDAFENEECPYRVHEPVLSLDAFFERLREEEEEQQRQQQFPEDDEDL